MELTKNFLINEYRKGKQIRELAKELGYASRTICEYNKKYGISTPDYNPRYKYRDKEWLIEQFSIYGNVSNVAKKTGYPRTCISRYAEKYQIRKPLYNRLAKNKINENFLKHIESEEEAYFLGFAMADGCMCRYKNGRYQFSIKIKSTDINILLKLVDAIGFDREKIKTGNQYRNGTLVSFCEILIGNQVFCKNLLRLGIIQRKTGHEKIPKEIPKEYIRHFIRGFVDGDGWVYLVNASAKQTIGCCSRSKEIIEQIAKVFKDNIGVDLNITVSKKLYRINTSAKKKCYLISKYLYDNSNIHLDRKYENAINIINSGPL